MNIDFFTMAGINKISLKHIAIAKGIAKIITPSSPMAN